MTEFITMAVLFGVVVGGFFGLMFTVNSKGWKKVCGLLITMVITGCVISGMFCAERAGDEQAWNNGTCPNCGTEWHFSSADHIRNGGTLYYWTCDNCGRVIELHSQFSK